MMLSNRVLYTADCTYLFEDRIYNPAGGAYTAKVFHDHVNLLADSGVDTYLVNPNAQLAYYPSEKFPRMLADYTPGDREYFRRHAIHCHGIPPEKLESFLDNEVKFWGHYLELQDAGVDWVAECARACRRRKITPWLSIRMNDIHGAGDPEGSFMNCALYRDASKRLRGTSFNPADGMALGWQGLNYELREVRDHMMRLIRELIEYYDYDGMELDWLRNPQCCNPVASRSAIDTMTEWIASIRTLTNEKAKNTGKAYPLGLRVAGNLGMHRSNGLDVREIARSGLVDFVSPSNFWQTSWDMPHDQIRAELGDKVTIFGVVEDAPNWFAGYSPKYDRTGTRMLSSSPEMLRANAAGKLALGAAGIEVFNFFCTDTVEWQPDVKREGRAKYEMLAEMGSLETLRGKPKHYTLSSSGKGTWYPPFELAEQLPAVLEPQSRRAFRLSMCAEPAARERKLDLVVQVIIEHAGGAKVPILGASVNGCWPTYEATMSDRFIFPVGIYTHMTPGHVGLSFRFDASEVREGWNEFTIYNHARFHELITTGERATAEDRAKFSVRVMSIEIGVVPGA